MIMENIKKSNKLEITKPSQVLFLKYYRKKNLTIKIGNNLKVYKKIMIICSNSNKIKILPTIKAKVIKVIDLVFKTKSRQTVKIIIKKQPPYNQYILHIKIKVTISLIRIVRKAFKSNDKAQLTNLNEQYLLLHHHNSNRTTLQSFSI